MIKKIITASIVAISISGCSSAKNKDLKVNTTNTMNSTKTWDVKKTYSKGILEYVCFIDVNFDYNAKSKWDVKKTTSRKLSKYICFVDLNKFK